MLLLAAIDTGALLKVVAASFVAGIGVTAAFATAIMGATRFVDLRRDGRNIEAGALAGLAALALIACVAAVVVGIVVMTSK
jgi:hypothetical protein